MLDTNTVSHLLKSHPGVLKRLVDVPMAALCISAITEGELLFGLAKRPAAKQLHLAVREFLRRVEVLPWDGAAAECYGSARANLAKSGKILGPLDLLIVAHAASLGAVLVTNDQAIRQMAGLPIEDWTI
ncbi:type II toxin-antitoxin system VapC family toxin [Castellaniella sp.]|uniref:type II toxin-antitoxin system VapC family toxin n=1 Tax=Castellaniella sp. TaxID=1955812 RepID=UPI0025BCDFC5|nr:type II toxin-antitoxin system VapC family toxin [Castellaniella sp.]